MAFVLLTENCMGRHIKYICQDGEFYEKGVGKEYSGTLALQTFDNRPYMRITFADTKNLLRAGAKKLFGMGYGVIRENPFKAAKAANNDQELCKFDFSKEDLQLGRKKSDILYRFGGCHIWQGLSAMTFPMILVVPIYSLIVALRKSGRKK